MTIYTLYTIIQVNALESRHKTVMIAMVPM